MDELVKSIDALSREQLTLLVTSLGLSRARVPVLLPGAAVASLPLAPTVSEEDRRVVENLVKIVNFLTKGGDGSNGSSSNGSSGAGAGRPFGAGGGEVVAELLPYLPAVAREVLPQLGTQLVGRISARFVRELFVPAPARR
ncbi:aarF domain-containing kinase [Monoraphidium neglectum]|uniref:AarF domain-containing kinase n=1 Tax=Monoraphidium neglectum TaxID=145388 RepID=A0A0D2LVF1_9CHLO|nr:aarF domain-containing kinase [Monoraphidium neglectum]KIY93586.1 aarF domain-containing kinase [Monoraphidium neglectum]|eukprot:XP_013892606.1 aarF domain-containing kinase [Monoraphidium neglectum]